jgi:NADH-quinone oxidoreductase subunit J
VTADIFLFWFLALLTLGSGLTVVCITNPIYSALALAMTMIGVSALFVTLGAYFLAGVQIIVYAGAVTVLFVMVLMLFDLKHEVLAFARGKVSGVFKVGSAAALGGLLIGAIFMTIKDETAMVSKGALDVAFDYTKDLSKILFTQYVFGFEALGALLLIIAIGAVALARAKGGTHARE